MSDVRTIKAGFTFLLFGKRAEAIQLANSLTSQNDIQYRAKSVKEEGGFVVVSANGQSIYDAAGSLPPKALKLFENRGAYLEWGSK